MLVVPRKLARRRIERERRVAVEIRGPGERNRVELAAMPFGARVWRWIRDAPIDQLEYRVVVSRQSPRRREAFVLRRAGPTRAAWVVVACGGVEPPCFGARQRIVCGDVAVLSRRP